MVLRSDNTHGDHTRSIPFELRASADADGLTLEGYGTTFDDWYDVEDWLGTYRERVARGSFAKTIKERRGLIRVQYDHGAHPVLGSIPIGSLSDIREDAHGLFVSVRLHDNWMTEPVRDAIKSQAVAGMSIRFQTTKDEWDYDSNPEERTIREVKLYEVGPVAFPANEATSVALRSLVRSLGASGADLEALRGMIPGERTDDAAGSTTADESAAVGTEPTCVTRQERRQMALLLSGVTQDAFGATA